MVAKFERQGIELQYPDNWTAEVEEFESGWSIAVQSPATAFLTLTYDEGCPGVGEFADSALDAIKDEYKELDAEPVVEPICGQPAVGYDVQFFSFDLTNSCQIRAFAVDGGTVLLIWQANDLETQNVAVLKAITASLKAPVDA